MLKPFLSRFFKPCTQYSSLGPLIQLLALKLLHDGPCVQTSVCTSLDLTKMSLICVTLSCCKMLVPYIVIVLNDVSQVTLHICLVVLGATVPYCALLKYTILRYFSVTVKNWILVSTRLIESYLVDAVEVALLCSCSSLDRRYPTPSVMMLLLYDLLSTLYLNY